MTPDRQKLLRERIARKGARPIVAEDVLLESVISDDRFGNVASAAEGYGVLVREMSELEDAQHQKNMWAIIEEAIQVASVASRLAEWALEHIDDENPRI